MGASLSRPKGGGNRASALPAPSAGRCRRRGRRVAVLATVPLVRLLLEPPAALVVPRAGTMTVAAPATGAAEDPSDQEERPEQEQREEEEPWEEVRSSVPHDVDDLHLLTVLLGDVDLLDPLGDAGALAGSVRTNPDADPTEDHHQQGDDRESSTHLGPPSSRVCLHDAAQT